MGAFEFDTFAERFRQGLKVANMDTILDFVFPLIPAVLVFVTAYIFFNRMRNDQHAFQQMLVRLEERKHSLPLQLKAYERLIIMLERITPSALVMRLNKPGMTASQLQLELLKAVRDEYDLNVSMQMYVSRTAWELTGRGRDEVVESIKSAAIKAGATGTAMDLSRHLFAIEEQSKNQSVKQALEVLRLEARKMM